MKKRFLFLFIMLMFVGMLPIKAFVIGDCDVIASYKLNSSQDKDSYICKNKDYQTTNATLSYKKNSSIIHFNNLNIYSMQLYGEDITLEIEGKNTIALLHITSSFQVNGKGNVKFKEGSFVKKVVQGEPVYKFVYKNKVVLTNQNQPYVGTLSSFEEDYSTLQSVNKLPPHFLSTDYEMLQELDYTKMTSVPISTVWLDKNVKSSLEKSIVDGYGVLTYVARRTYSQLESEDVILLTEDKIDSNYALVVNNLENEVIKKDVEKSLDGDDTNLVSLYDVSVYNGKKEVSMKEGNYTVKIKLQDSLSDYEDYQIIYINDEGVIEEYIDASIEGDYIVFSTSHLSQYGIVAKDAVSIPLPSENSSSTGFLLKVSFLFMIVFLFVICIFFLAVKANVMPRKKKRKKL